MKVFIPAVLFSTMLSGCSIFGLYIQKHAERAPPEEAARVEFPDSFRNDLHIPGPLAVALEVAMNDFLPPGSKVTTNDPDKRIAECLSRKSSYEILAMKASDDLFFIKFIPNLKHCGIEEHIFDGGAIYAIDGKGRILNALF